MQRLTTKYVNPSYHTFKLLLEKLKTREIDEFLKTKDTLYKILQDIPSLEFNRLIQNESTCQVRLRLMNLFYLY